MIRYLKLICFQQAGDFRIYCYEKIVSVEFCFYGACIDFPVIDVIQGSGPTDE